MNIIITKQDFDDITDAVMEGTEYDHPKSEDTRELWENVKTAIKLGLPLVYQEEVEDE